MSIKFKNVAYREYSGKLLLLGYPHIHIVRMYDSIFQSKFLLSLFHTYRLYDHDYQFAPYGKELEPDVNRNNKVRNIHANNESEVSLLAEYFILSCASFI